MLKFKLVKYGLHLDCRGKINEVSIILLITQIFQNYEKINRLYVTNAYLKVLMCADVYKEVCLTMETVYSLHIQLLYNIKYQHLASRSKKGLN